MVSRRRNRVNVIDLLRKEQKKPQVPVLHSGDTVRVHVKVVEGSRERIQVFEGVVIAVRGKQGTATRFTVRRISHGVGVERTFLLHSPRLDKIEVIRHGDVRRAKLFYLRDKIGKSARIRELRTPRGGATVQIADATVVVPEDEDVLMQSDIAPEVAFDEESSEEVMAGVTAETTEDE